MEKDKELNRIEFEQNTDSIPAPQSRKPLNKNEIKDTGVRVSGGHRVLECHCQECGRLFKRQARRLEKERRKFCRSCLKSKVPRLHFWPSHKLYEVIRNEGYTDDGKEYFDYLHDMKEIIWEREDRIIQKLEFDFV